MVMTVGSVVFCPEDGLVWVATGEAPTSRNRFVAFDLRCERRAHEAPSFSVDDGESAEARRAFARYRDAYVLHLDHGDASGALAAMDDACRLAPEEPVFHFLRGLLALELRAHAVAEQAFDRAIALGHPHPERRAAFHLWRARTRGEQGQRDEANADYRACLALRADAPVHAAARREHGKPWSGKRRAIDFSMGDVVTP
jgi:tetratricopeptide (TPR) repeat protein